MAAACASRGDLDLATGDEADPVTVSQACGGAPDDPLHLSAVALEGQRLRVTVSHSGGCAAHAYAACWSGLIQETAPPRTTLTLHHDANGDACDAHLSRDVLIDVSDLGFEIGAAAVIEPDGTIQLLGK